MVGVFLLFHVSLASELCRVKEQLTKIVALHKFYVVLRTHYNNINFKVEGIRNTNSTYFTIISLFQVIDVGCFIWANRVEP